MYIATVYVYPIFHGLLKCCGVNFGAFYFGINIMLYYGINNSNSISKLRYTISFLQVTVFVWSIYVIDWVTNTVY